MPLKITPKKPRSYTPIIVIVIIVILILIGGGTAVWYFLLRKRKLGDDCTASNQCSTGLVCASGKCSDSAIVECQTSEDCNDDTKECDLTIHKCVSKPECSSTQPCSDPLKTCDLNLGACVNIVQCDATHACPSGKVCDENGQCVIPLGCSPNNPCDPGFICNSSSVCVNGTPCNTTTLLCPSDQECRASDSICVPKPECLSSTDCSSGHKCRAGYCVPSTYSECTQMDPCPTGSQCLADPSNGAFKCFANSEVPYGGGACAVTSDCHDNPQFGWDYICAFNKCVNYESTMPCTPGVTVCPMGYTCNHNAVTDPYLCTRGTLCTNPGNCRPGESCVQDPSDLSEIRRYCTNMKPSKYCDYSAQCGAGQSCVNGACKVIGECGQGMSCGEGFTCINGVCS